MKHLRAALEFYLDSSIHVAVAVCSLVYVTVFEYDLSVETNLLGFIFFATISGYNFVKYFGIARFHHRSLTSRLKAIQIFSFFAFGLMLYFAYFLPAAIYWHALALALVTFLYAVPFLGKRTLRMFSGLKIFAVSLVWASVTVLLPVLAVSEVIDLNVWLTFVQRFIMVIVITIPFEIRDLRYDSTALGTLPQKLGVNASKWLAVILMYFGFTLDLFKDEFSCSHIVSFAITAFVCALALWGAKKDQKPYYASFFVESIPVFWVLIFYLLKYYFQISC